MECLHITHLRLKRNKEIKTILDNTQWEIYKTKDAIEEAIIILGRKNIMHISQNKRHKIILCTVKLLEQVDEIRKNENFNSFTSYT